ncbi:MAG: hypothetical protein P0Y55_09240 [Candidatus Cohnella colombiensis]|uniref:Flagellar hook-length control protein FliK n=1 Tax=Candidatus Cohnella colombiensis TaxID=3121368 RepID=A0AA95JDD3_9BACL|nr:MAG: hypothetical protein P0Y55_09240 [Cohnella sp.]
MGMNIGPMLKAMMGDAQPADSARALELRIGQIVRGVLIEMLDNQEGMLNINGVQVRAKLEADMPVGRSMLLQVQPNSNGGLVALKPLVDATEASLDDIPKDLLKAFGLSEQKGAMELLRGLKRDGFPLSKDTAAFYQTAMSAKPANVDMQTWMGTADVAFRRGLPPTEATLSALRQALFNTPLQQGLQQLSSALGEWLGGKTPVTAEGSALGARLQQVISQGAAIVAEGEAQLSGDASRAATTSAKPQADGARSAQLLVGNRQAPTGADASRLVNGTQQEHAVVRDATLNVARSNTGIGANDAGGAGASRPAPEQATARPPIGGGTAQAQPAPLAAEPQAAARANSPAPAAATPPPAADIAARSASGNVADASASSAPKGEAAWIGRFLQWLGVGHEHKLLHNTEPLARLPGDNAAGLPAQQAGADNPAPASDARAADTLKSALLALAASDDVPPALREAASTLANQVTGQQLMLSSERGQTAPFSHMTLFIPMKNGEGDTTATVHVQARRSRRGEWDTDNCRLLFDLRMKNVGDTVVDVQVVDRIVSLKLLNDFPGMSEMIEQAREELTNGMRATGYQLLSLSVSPLPEWRTNLEVASEAGSVGSTPLEKLVPTADFATKPYKGVDFRA